ncbi:MAG TPA: hypothetical protein VFB52_00125 [Solirubrobacterales bacterium]|nr:hypothetical protein [Solirubrobacterales bacterium]
MTEKAAKRILLGLTVLAAAALAVGVRVFQVGDEALVYGTMSIVIVSSLAVGQITVHYGPSRQHRDDD